MSDADVSTWIRVQVEPGLEAATKMLVLFALDTGVRIAEALDLKRADVDGTTCSSGLWVRAGANARYQCRAAFP
jgi:integrase